MKRNLTFIFLIGLILSSFWQMADNISAQQKPLTMAQILTGLQTAGKTAETKTLAARNKYIANRVSQTGASFPLTAEREQDLREAGATDELIEAIRQNSPPIPTPTKSTPTPKTSTPVSTPTPKSTPTVSGKEMKNSIGMEFVKIPSGSFMMGGDKFDGEKPVHKVTINYEFYMGKYEVTVGEWEKVMGDVPAELKSADAKFRESDYQPIIYVSWNDAQEFIKKLNAKNDGYEYRLPSEAEWEYAARAGTTTKFAFGNDLSSNQANFNGNYPYGNAAKGKYLKKTVEVGSYKPNDSGLYDMHGNVWEWVEDVYSSSYNFRALPTNGSANMSVGDLDSRVLRGGSWYNYGDDLRSAYRYGYAPAERLNFIGFRLVARASLSRNF